MGDTPGHKVLRNDSLGYCFQGDVAHKYSEISRTGFSFFELRKKVINRPRCGAAQGLNKDFSYRFGLHKVLSEEGLSSFR